MTIERDELAQIISNNSTVIHDSHYGDVTASTLTPDEMADAILAAGYRKPQQVTTVEELDALPDEAAVLTRHGAVYIHSGKCWQGVGAGRFYSVWFEKSDSLPATVLHIGGTK